MVFRLIRPLFEVRMALLASNRIGALIPESAKYLRTYKKKSKKLELYGTVEVSNKYWIKIIKRAGLPIYGWWVKYLVFWNKFLPCKEFYVLPNQNSFLYEDGDWNYKYKNIIRFSNYEKTQGEKWLRNHGWTDGEPYICLMVRDNEYLNKHKPPRHHIDWSYHSYRNSDVDDYVPGISWLIEQGYWVIRMGSNMAKPVGKSSKNFIDYSFCPEKSDFLDIWLFANCTFTVSTGTGPDVIAPLFDKPILYINALPMTAAILLYKSIFVPKKLFKSEGSKPLTIKEYFVHNYTETYKYEQADIVVKNLDSSEILQYIREFECNVKSDFKLNDTQLSYQKEFWEIFFSIHSNSEMNKYKNPNAIISNIWLNAYN